VTRERFIPIHTIAAKLGPDVCRCLPQVHALTGCDSTSSLFGIGKKTAYSVLCKIANLVSSNLSFDDNVSLVKWIEGARTLVLSMYGNKGKRSKTLDDVHYLFATTTDKPATQLPPADDAFKVHASRARYQSFIWCCSHVPKPELDAPDDSGWFLDSSGLHPVMYTQESAPAEVRDLTHLFCNCKDNDCKDGTKCTCVLAGLKCIELCNCEDCPNVQSVTTYVVDD
jgi:hypothetical protein